ncbi:MAG: LON peptidase substrate-binding domain-containing protein [Planctomycetes bacterium]|nr:LON peptidase substrate-binding domain-containing protein [Planctomycetota bacterium]
MQPCDATYSGHGSSPGAIVPMFPLPGVFLFPGTIMPLHIFEPRYRQMIEDSLDGPGRIVMATVLEGQDGDLRGSPPVHHIGGLGEIVRHERLPDGRFLILLAGLTRVLLREVPSDRLYRRVEAIALREIAATPAREAELRPQLLRAIAQRSKEPVEIPNDMPLGQIADLLLTRLGLEPSRMQELFSLTKVDDRSRSALEEHARRARGNRD